MLYRKIIVSEENYPTLDNVTKNFFEKTNHQMDKEQVELLKKSLEFRKKPLQMKNMKIIGEGRYLISLKF